MMFFQFRIVSERNTIYHQQRCSTYQTIIFYFMDGFQQKVFILSMIGEQIGFIGTATAQNDDDKQNGDSILSIFFQKLLQI